MRASAYRRFFTAITLLVLLYLAAAFPLARLIKPTQASSEEEYLSPAEMAFSPDGATLYVLCEHSDELLAVDPSSGKVLHRAPVGHLPRGLFLSPKTSALYISNSWDDTVTVVDTKSFQAVRTLHTGAEPSGLLTDQNGSTLYVANRIGNSISVIDMATGQEKKHLTAGRGASYLAITPDGSRIYSTHIYPNGDTFRTPAQSEITVVDTARQTVVDRVPLKNVAGVFHIATSDDGRLSVVAQMRPKNLVPLAHVEHGWVITNSLTLFGADVGQPVQIPLDELEQYASLPFGVAISHDKSRIYVSAASVDKLIVIDTARLFAFLREHKQPFLNDLSASGNYVIARIPVGHNPRGILLSPDGKHLYITNRLDDSISVLDTSTNRVTATLPLGSSTRVSALRRGEQYFYSAKYSFHGQFACANCHLDSTFDGLAWDLEPDGFGQDIVDNRLLEDLRGTEPFKWNGGNPDIPTECGPRTEKYFFRSQGFSQKELADLVLYIRNLPLRPNRHRLPGGELTAAQERGKLIFERVRDKRKNPIPQIKQCSFCHSGPKYTNQKQFDVGTGKATDRSPVFDTPQLTNIGLTAPYLHDGSARTLEEIWTVFNPRDIHGVTNDLTKDELNDLIEYLRTL